MLPHGPKEIGRNRQVALPAELLKAVKLDVGDKVFFALADEPSGALLVLPVELVSQWIDTGRRSERSPEATDQDSTP